LGKIINFGLNYSDQHSFQSDVLIHIDEGINVADYKEKYSEDAFKAAHELTDEIRLRIEKQIVAIEDAEIDKLVKNIEIIYKSQLIKDLGFY
jgi:glycerol-3-phosphate O-acyltransferase / dihydroxyacetone phosphate acyltransferase